MAPYFTWDVEGWSVTQRIVAVLSVTGHAATELMTGPLPPPVETVEKELLPDVADTFELFADTTSKLYVVPGVRPLTVTE